METQRSSLNWDAKTVLAALFIIGYFVLVGALPMVLENVSQETREIVDGLLEPLKPVIGIIAFALWRNSRRDNLEAEANARAVENFTAQAIAAKPAAEPVAGEGADPWPDNK